MRPANAPARSPLSSRRASNDSMIGAHAREPCDREECKFLATMAVPSARQPRHAPPPPHCYCSTAVPEDQTHYRWEEGEGARSRSQKPGARSDNQERIWRRYKHGGRCSIVGPLESLASTELTRVFQ